MQLKWNDVYYIEALISSLLLAKIIMEGRTKELKIHRQYPRNLLTVNIYYNCIRCFGIFETRVWN